jgi:hypothetical protein
VAAVAAELSSLANPASGPESVANQTGADLRAEIAANRRARRNPRPVAQSPTQGSPANNPEPQTSDPAVTPEAGEAVSPDPTNLTSAPEAEGQSQDPSATPPTAESEGEQPTDNAAAAAESDLLDDPEAIAEMSEAQIAGIKDATVRKLVRRIHKLTARAKAAEAKATQVPDKSEPQAQTFGNADPEIAKLDSRITLIERAAQWAKANPDGGDFVGDDGKVIARYSPEEVDRILATAPLSLARLEAQREVRSERLRTEETANRTKAVEAAKTAYPWLSKTDSDEYATVAQLVQSAPYIRQHPEWPLWVADAVEGRKARLAREAGASTRPSANTPAPRPTPPRVPVPGGSAVPRHNPLETALKEAEARFRKSGKAEDAKQEEILRRQLRRQQMAVSA